MGGGGRFLVSTRPSEKFSPEGMDCCFGIVNIPVTRIVEAGLRDEAREKIVHFDPDSVVFTSTRGVEIFFRDLAGSMDCSGMEFYGIGDSTCASVESRGFECSIPAVKDSSGLADLLSRRCSDRRVLLFRSGQANRVIDARLEEEGIDFLSVTAYNVVPLESFDANALESPDCFGIIFTSAMEVQSLISLLGMEKLESLLGRLKVFSIGSFTTRKLQENGITISEPRGDSDFTKLMADICNFYC